MHITYSCRMANRRLTLASLSRYVCKDGRAWLLAERPLYVDWLEAAAYHDSD